MYLFFDEIQRIAKWQYAVNSFRVDFDSDIDIIGSNAYLLSSEFSTYLSCRYVEIKRLPLSFLESHDFSVQNHLSPSGKLKYLKTLGKYYIVYFELLRRGYDVALGKVENLEIDFVATKGDGTRYIQGTHSMADEKTRERELKPLKLLRNG